MPAPIKIQAKDEDDEATKKLKEAAKVAFQNGARAHSEWDRRVRAWNGELSASRVDLSSCGSFVEKSLESTIAAGKVIDDEFCDLETTNFTSSLSQEQVDRIAMLCDEIFRLIKKGASVVGVLRTTMRL